MASEKKEQEQHPHHQRTSQQQDHPPHDARANTHANAHACRNCEKKEEAIAEITNTAKRVQAEFENYQKRTAKEQEEFRRFAVEQFLKRLLAVFDSFEQALKHTQAQNAQSAQDNCDDGLRLIHAQLLSLAKAEGLQRIECVGKKYDAHTAEVMLTVPQEPSNIVLEEFQAGYLFQGKVLRHAKVKISVAAEEGADAQKQHEHAGDAA